MADLPPTIHYSPRGYEATYDPATDTCAVVVRGYVRPDGKIVERGGPAHPDDKVIARFTIANLGAASSNLGATGFSTSHPANIGATGFSPSPVRETFHDSLSDRRDLLGNPDFRHRPSDAAERRLFAAAFDAAQKIRARLNVLAVNHLVFSLNPSLFAVVDCFARDAHGFWLMNAEIPQAGFGAAIGPVRSDQSLPLAAYILERGGYVPATASVRLGVWSLLPTGAKFSEIPNDRAAARDAVIDHLCATPF